MAITASDIENVSFSISKKGYDVDEVDLFLEHVATEIDNLNKLIAGLRAANSSAAPEPIEAPSPKPEEVVQEKEEEQALPGDTIAYTPTEVGLSDVQLQRMIEEKDRVIESLQDKLNSKSADDSAISQALIVAQRSADEIIAKANSKADSTIADAHDEADRIVSRAEDEKESIMEAIAKLEEDKEDSRNGYAELLRDFISDASTKLNSLGFQQASASGDSDIDDFVSSSSVNISDKPVSFTSAGDDADDENSASVNSDVVEKDMSGFGAIAEDDDLD